MAQDIKTRIHNRVATLLKTDSVDETIAFMSALQKEQTPFYTTEQIENLVYQGIINLYDDRVLDFLWFSYKNSAASSSHQTFSKAA